MNKHTGADLEAIGRAAIPDRKGHCQVCGKEVTTGANGIPQRTHHVETLHNPDAHPDHHVRTKSECYGSRLPVKEYAEAFEAARNSK